MTNLPPDKSISPKPCPAEVIDQQIPAELRERDQWVNWRYELDKRGEWTKVPYQTNGRKADSTNRRTWTTFQAVLAAYHNTSLGFDGVGYVFSGEPDDFIGIDLDHCR